MELLLELERRMGTLEERFLRLALWGALGEPMRCSSLVRRYGSARAVFESNTLPPASLNPERVARRWEAELKAIERLGISVLVPEDEAWPASLLQCPSPPELLFVRGDTALLKRSDGLAVVGSRKLSLLGGANTDQVCRFWLSQGGFVVSGGALGVDSAAHEAALAENGSTLVVLASSLDKPYPAGNRRLFERVLKSGTLVTEMPSQGHVRPQAFPTRNRLIAALSSIIVIIQARRKSGALHTATYGRRMKKDVRVVPGPMGDPSWEGSNDLLRSGISPLTAPDQLRNVTISGGVCREATPVADKEPCGADGHKRPLSGLDKTSRFCLDVVARGPCHVDDLVEKSGLSPGQLSRVLLRLELDGWVRMQAGHRVECIAELER